jgi:hydrogenase large subunit
MASIIVIDPVTRIEGHLKVTVTIDSVGGEQQVVDAWTTGTLFRGIENILLDRHPWDAQHITQRICGVCPVPHSMASVLALQQASGVSPPPNATLLRNLVLAANFLDSHILHFYHLTTPDYVDGPAMPPWQPAWQSDRRIDAATTAALVNNYATALDIRRKAHEMGALFGGRMPHPPVFLPGGITTTPRRERIAKFREYLSEVRSFIDGPYLSDVQTIASAYGDYFSVGRGPGNMLSFGVFGSGPRGDTDPLFKRGRVLAASTAVETMSTRAIAEQVTYSWYDEETQNLKPTAGATTPLYPKANAYSWIKAPRYDGRPYEVGPLARMWINGDYQRGVSVMDRHAARAQEASKLASAMASWLDQLDSNGPVTAACTVPPVATGEGLTEAPRGALGHWLRIDKSRIGGYQVVTPTCWNASPRDVGGGRGPMEEALVGIPVRNAAEPIEVLRVIHSFDPCLACAVHVARPGRAAALTVVRSG